MKACRALKSKAHSLRDHQGIDLDLVSEVLVSLDKVALLTMALVVSSIWLSIQDAKIGWERGGTWISSNFSSAWYLSLLMRSTWRMWTDLDLLCKIRLDGSNPLQSIENGGQKERGWEKQPPHNLSFQASEGHIYKKVAWWDQLQVMMEYIC